MNNAQRGGDENGKRRPRIYSNHSTPLSTSATLIADLSDQVDRLARIETQLAAREFTRKADRSLFRDRLFSLATLCGLYGGAALVACAIVVVALIIPLWSSVLFVGIGLVAIGGLLYSAGKVHAARSKRPMPTDGDIPITDEFL